MESKNTAGLRQALSAHRADGRYSLGTAPVVESLHADWRLSYEEIAAIAGVSLAGLRRWRELNRGDRASFEPLLTYAEKLVNGEAPEPGDAKDTPHTAQQYPNQPHAPASDTRQVPPLTIADAKRGLSLMFGVDPAMIEIMIRG
jgi:hypothetical protein